MIGYDADGRDSPRVLRRVIGFAAMMTVAALGARWGLEAILAAPDPAGRAAGPEAASLSARAAAPEAVREIVIPRGRSGHYVVEAVVNGATVAFIIDTGASGIALSREAAERAGFSQASLSFSRRYHTANGIARAAPVTLRELRIGQLSLYDVEASVMEREMPISLLGMSFLSRLGGHEVRDGRLILRW